MLQAAFTQYGQGNLAAAEALLLQVLAAEREQPDAMRLLGEVLADRGRFGEAITLLQRLLRLQPGNAPAHYAIGNAYRRAGSLDAAITAYRSSVALEPNFAGSHHGLGLAYASTERDPEALAHFRQATRLQPDWAPGWKSLGLTHAKLGEIEAAEAALRRAVALQPMMAEAQRHLAALRRQPADQAELRALTARAANPGTASEERIELAFTLGRLNEKAGAYDTAFAHFAAGNRLLRDVLAKAKRSFDRNRLHRDVDQIIAKFPRAVFANYDGLGNSTGQPVFIVGMPRAGSTLFEQIAASHPSVLGAGEQRGIGAIARRFGWAPSPAWTEQSIAASAREYLDSLPDTDAERIIDKMPDNIFQLGLIAVLFPNARVIFCERDPRDLAISCFFQLFSEPHGFDTDLGDIAFRIRELERLKAHWMAALPLRCLSFSYEELVADPEAESRRLIAFLGLEWDEKCLDFHKSKRPVRTASWAQVRQPLYATSSGRWKHYQSHLAPFLQALSDTGSPGH